MSTTKTNLIQPTREELTQAVDVLADHFRGKQCLAALLTFISAGGDGLDIVNQDAVMTILRAQFGPFSGSTRNVISQALHHK